MIEFLSTWREMGWQAASLLTAAAFGIGTVAVIALCTYFSETKREIRAIRRIRRLRQKAFQILLSTSPTGEQQQLSSLLRRQA